MAANASSSCSPVQGAAVERAPVGYREAFLGIFILALLLICVGLAAFLKERRRSGRLAKRSVTLILVSATASVLSCFVVFFREYYGRSHFSCLAVLVIHHLVIPLVAGPLVAKVYVHAYRLRRSRIRAGLSFAAVKKEQERIDRREAKPGQGFVQDLSAFVTLQSEPAKHSLRAKLFGVPKLNASTKRDSFEMVSPTIGEDSYDVAKYDDDHVGFLPASPSSQRKLYSPIRPSAPVQHQRQESTGSDPMLSSRQSLVELSAGLEQPSSSASPTMRQATRKSKSKTEDIVRKVSRNSSATAADVVKRTSKHNSRVSSSLGGVGWWNPRAQELESEVRLDELVKNESTIWGLFMVLLFVSPFVVVIIIRALSDPNYSPECTGCDFSPLDVYIQCGLSLFMMTIFFSSTLAFWNTPDPLGIMWESKLCAAVFLIFGVPTAALYLSDPSGIEQSYSFTWLAFETLAIFLILMIQTLGQVAFTRWSNSNVPKAISLFRLLENVELRDMFDDHLASEFSIENLRFWDRAIHWKISYEDMPPDEIQRRAKDLYSVFVQRDAAMALNLSAINFLKLQSAFTPGASEPVSRDVFDDALKECFKLMNDGLARFLVSDKYKLFLKQVPDFEGDMLRNRELGLDLNATVDKYLKQLEGLQSRSSFTNGTSTMSGDSTSRKASRPSVVSPFTAKKSPDIHMGQLPSSVESSEDDHLDEEKSRPLSLTVRKSISYDIHVAAVIAAQQVPTTTGGEPRRSSNYALQLVPSQSLSTPTKYDGSPTRSSPQKSAARSSMVQVDEELS